MSKKNQDKRKAKRAEKARMFRKSKNARPVDKISDRDPIECWSSRHDGIDAIITFRQVKGGDTVAVNFLIDYDCIGLKDAFFVVGMTRAELENSLSRPGMPPEMAFKAIPLTEVQRRVAAAMQWTRAHPFKLPADAAMCAKLIGLDDSTEGADVSEFGQEDGTLFYVGSKPDLLRRLKGITLEELRASPDFDCDFFDMETGEAVDDDEEVFGGEEDGEDIGSEIAELQKAVGEKLLAAARKWCFANGKVPEPGLPQAVGLVLEGTSHVAMDPELSEDDALDLEAGARSFQTLLATESEEMQESIRRAAAQLGEFMDQFKSQEELFVSLGLVEG